MKATELRIGNLLNYQTAEGDILTTTIDWQDLKWISEDEQSFNLVHSETPLTEEWLLKFGFKQISERVYIINYHYGYEFGITNIFIIKNDNCFMRYKHIQHVHELQNLYFALTGEELSL